MNLNQPTPIHPLLCYDNDNHRKVLTCVLSSIIFQLLNPYTYQRYVLIVCLKLLVLLLLYIITSIISVLVLLLLHTPIVK